MQKLSPHEQKIFDLVQSNPEIITDPEKRKKIALENGMSEKTLRNRIGDLKRYGLIQQDLGKVNFNDENDNKLTENILFFWKNRRFVYKWTGYTIIASIIISLLLPKWYASEAVILSSGAGNFNFISSISPIPIGDFGLSSINEDINNFISILKSRSLKEHLVNKFQLVERYGSRDIEYAMLDFEEKMELLVTEEGALSITIIDKEPIIAKLMVDEVLITLDSITQSLNMEAGRNNREFLEERLSRNKIELANSEKQLKEFQERTGIIDFITQASSLMESKYKSYEAKYESYSSVYTETYTQIYPKKVETEIQLEVAKRTLPAGNPTIFRLEEALKEHERQLKILSIKLDEFLKELFTEVSNLLITNSDEVPFVVPISELPRLGLENARLVREVEMKNMIQEILIPQYEQAKLEENKNIPTLQLIDVPTVALNKAKPKRAYIVIGATILSIIFSLAFLYINEHSKSFRLRLKNI